MSNRKIHKDLMSRVDVFEAVSWIMDEAESPDSWDGSNNVACLFMEERHMYGEDRKPSMSIDAETGKTFCHACAYKASTYVGLAQDVIETSYYKTLELMWHKFVEPLVQADEVTKANAELLGSEVMLLRLLEKRGLTADTAAKFMLGWRGDKLWIPIPNKHKLWVDVRKYDLMERGDVKILSYRKGYGGARLYPQWALKGDDLVLVEGELDAILGQQHGINCVTATTGIKTWKSHLSAPFKGKRVTVIPDNDKPGLDGAQKRMSRLTRAGVASICMVKLPVKEDGEDLTDYILKYGGDLSKLLRRKRKVRRRKDQSMPAARQPPLDVVVGDEDSKRLVVPLKEGEEANIDRGHIIVDGLLSFGGFFTDNTDELYFATNGGRVVNLFDKREMEPYLFSLNEVINSATPTGRMIISHIRNAGRTKAVKTNMGTWSLYKDPCELYVHAGGGRILRADRKGVRHISNAINDDRVLLEMPQKGLPLTYDRSATIQSAVEKLWDLVALNLPCAEEDRYLVCCWLVGILMREFVKAKPLLRFTAKSSGGKSTALNIVGALFYGHNVDSLMAASSTTSSAAYTMARSYPFLMFDNMETRNMTNETVDFLLVASTGASKVKRKRETDKGLIYEETNCVVATDGIEPFNRTELISRNIDIVLLNLKEYGRGDDFNIKTVEAAIVGARNEILSGLVKLIRKFVFPRIARGEMDRIALELGSHSKERFNNYYALMATFLDAIWAFVPSKEYSTPRKMVNAWLDRQKVSDTRHEVETNEVLYYLNELKDRGDSILGVKTTITRRPNDKISFRAGTRQLLTDFRIVSRELALRCPWQNERQLGSRISDAVESLAKGGWTRRKRRSGGIMYYTYEFDPETVEGEED